SEGSGSPCEFLKLRDGAGPEGSLHQPSAGCQRLCLRLQQPVGRFCKLLLQRAVGIQKPPDRRCRFFFRHTQKSDRFFEDAVLFPELLQDTVTADKMDTCFFLHPLHTQYFQLANLAGGVWMGPAAAVIVKVRDNDETDLTFRRDFFSKAVAVQLLSRHPAGLD